MGGVWDFNKSKEKGENGKDRQRIYNKSLYHGDIFKKYQQSIQNRTLEQ